MFLRPASTIHEGPTGQQPVSVTPRVQGTSDIMQDSLTLQTIAVCFMMTGFVNATPQSHTGYVYTAD